MRQIFHNSARTTATVRRAIQASQASIRSLAKQFSINPKTIAKWKQRSDVQAAPMGPKQVCSTILRTEEVLIVAFRKHTLLPLDDCL
jgi:transposase-like protein